VQSSSAQADILAAPAAGSANEIGPFLILAARAACSSAHVTAAGALCTAQKFVSMAIVANRGARIPARTPCPLRHGIVQALGDAALASRGLARVATALAVSATHEVATRTLAASVTGPNTDVTTAGAADAALKFLAMASDTFDGIRCAGCALGHWVLVPWLPLVAALASRSGTSVATALAALLTRERITQFVAAAEIALGLASVATALTIATGEEMAPIVEARRHAEAGEKLAQIEGPRCLESQEGSLFALCTVQALSAHAGLRFRCSNRHHKGSCCNRLQSHGGKKSVMLREKNLSL